MINDLINDLLIAETKLNIKEIAAGLSELDNADAKLYSKRFEILQELYDKMSNQLNLNLNSCISFRYSVSGSSRLTTLLSNGS